MKHFRLSKNFVLMLLSSFSGVIFYLYFTLVSLSQKLPTSTLTIMFTIFLSGFTAGLILIFLKIKRPLLLALLIPIISVPVYACGLLIINLTITKTIHSQPFLVEVLSIFMVSLISVALSPYIFFLIIFANWYILKHVDKRN